MMNYRSYYDMSLAIWQYIPRLPVRYDLIVGVPQSGMIPAAMLASYLKVWLSSLDLFVNGECMTNGMSRTDMRKSCGLRDVHNVLVIDDSINSGTSIREARQLIETAAELKKHDLRVDYAAVYSKDGHDKDISFSFTICPMPRVFQWNIFNHPSVTKNSCYDIDGVLCGDPTPEQNDDGLEYERFLLTAVKCVNIRFQIGALISSRLEKYREQTIKWLRANGFKWKDLILLDLPSKLDRIRTNAHASFKAQIYRKRPETLFIESERKQAIEIAFLSGKDVFCTETMSYIAGGGDELNAAPLQKLFSEVEMCRLSRDESFEKLMKVRGEVSTSLEKEMAASRAAIKARLAAMTESRDEVRRKLADMEISRAKAREKLAAMTASRDELRQKLADMESSRAKAREKLAAMTASRDDVRQKLTAMEELRDLAQTRLARAKSVIGELEKDVSVLERIKDVVAED